MGALPGMAGSSFGKRQLEPALSAEEKDLERVKDYTLRNPPAAQIVRTRFYRLENLT
jgi:hypothetical protein